MIGGGQHEHPPSDVCSVDPAWQAPLLWTIWPSDCRALEVLVGGPSRLQAAAGGFLPGQFSVCSLSGGNDARHASGSDSGGRGVETVDWREEKFKAPDATFDVVLLTGIYRHPEARRNVRQILAEAQRVLKTGGTLAWTEPNAWALPLSIVDCTHFGREGWSLNSLVDLAMRSGLHPSGECLLSPNYLRPGYALPRQTPAVPDHIVRQVLSSQFLPLNRAGLRQRLKRLAARVAQNRWAHNFGPAWLVTATKRDDDLLSLPQDPVPSIVERIVRQAAGGPAQPLALLVRQTHAVVVPTWDIAGQRMLYIKMPLSPAAQRVQAAQQRMLTRLAERSDLTIVAPKLTAVGECDGLPFHAESALAGAGGGRIRAPLDALVSQAMDVLTRLHTATRRPEATAATVLWKARLEGFERHPLCVGSACTALADRTQSALHTLPCCVLAHNDFHLGNVIFDDRTRVTGVLDWDLADETGLPTCDAIHLALSAVMRRRLQPRGKALRELLSGKYPTERSAVGNYLQALALPDDLTPWLLLYAMTHVWRLVQQSAFAAPNSPRWASLRFQIDEMLELTR